MNPDNPPSRRETGSVPIYSLLYRRFLIVAPRLSLRQPPDHQDRPCKPCSSFNSCKLFFLFANVFLSLALTSSAAIPAPEQLLPEDTLILLTVPNYAKLRQICGKSPKGQLWNDPVLKPFKDKFFSRWEEEFVKPLERDLNLDLGTCASLPQGQLTFAVTKNAWQGGDGQPLGFLFLLDAQEKADLLRTNLLNLRTKWVAAGKSMKTERIRNLEFSVIPITTNDLPKTLSRFLWRSPVFPQVSGGPDPKQAPASSSSQGDMLLDMLTVVLTASKELVLGQVDSLLVVGNSLKGVEKVVVKLTGGAVPTLCELDAYQANQQALFRDAPFYGWVNVKTFVETLTRRASEARASETPDPFETLKPEKLISAAGLSGCRTLAFKLQDSSEGSLFQLFLGVPDAARQGVLQLFAGATREANPPPFILADAVDFFRWRLDGPKTWTTVERMLNELSPQILSAVNLILDTADARAKLTDPGFDLRKTLLANLGDDIISYQRAPRGNAPAVPQAPSSIFLLGSPNAEQLAVALKRLFVIFPQGDAPEEREFLGRRIFSIPVPPLPFITTGPPQSGAPSMLHCAASGGYVAMSTDSGFLEEYLRSSENQAKALREKPGLREAAQNVGGMSTGLFGYENQADAMRAAFAAARNDPAASTNGIGPSLFPGLPGMSGPETNLKSWMDFSLLPPFEKVAHYFYFSVYAASANLDGLSLKIFAPTPPAFRSNSVTRPAS